MSFRKSTRGFTVIELMITVAIAGMLLAVGLPNLQNLLQNQTVRTAASDMHISLLFARSEAIKRNANVELERNTTWNNGWDVEIQSDSTVLRTQDALSGLTVTCNTDSDTAAEACPATVTFSRTGRSSDFIEYRLFVNGNTNVTMRCVSLRLSGVPQVTVDGDTDSSNGCN